MQVTVNGQSRQANEGLTIGQFLSVGRLDRVRVAVELNGQVVPRAELDNVRLRDGDRLEVVTLVGGG